MSPLEEVQAAIAKLEELLKASSPGKWSAVRHNGELVWCVTSSEFGHVVTTGYVGNNDAKPHAELIATGHSTLDAQIQILKYALLGAADQSAGAMPDEPGATHLGIFLARAINGATA